jgi:hypothetical protein
MHVKDPHQVNNTMMVNRDAPPINSSQYGLSSRKSGFSQTITSSTNS